MKTFTKIFCILLCLCLITATAVGCGKKDSSTGGSTVQSTSSVTGGGSSADNTSSTPDTSTPTETGNGSDSASSTPTDTSSTASGSTQSNTASSNTSSDTMSESGTTPPPQTNTDPFISLESKQNGDTVTVTASIKNNPGLVAFKFQVVFDKLKLTPDNMAQSDLKLGITSNIKQGAAAKGEVSVLYIGTAGFKTDGQLFTLTFKVNKNANGTADFKIKSDNGSFLSTDATTYLDIKTFGTSVELK